MPKILIAVDGSAQALDAVHHTLQLMAGGLRATLVLANVQEPASLYELVTSRDPALVAAASEAAGEDLLAPARALLDAAGVPYETAVGIGDPANTLVELIESSACDMAVIGARGQGAVRSALLGSVSQSLAHASPVPVTIVRHAPPQVEPEDLLEAQQEEAEGGAADVLEEFRGGV